MNEHIEPFSYAEALMKALPKGVLLSTEKKGAMNTMVIGWGAGHQLGKARPHGLCTGKPLDPGLSRCVRRIYGECPPGRR
jgi:hypothetical protein